MNSGEYVLEVSYDGLPISWSSFNISVASGSCSLASTALSADTQPAVAGQAYQLVLNFSDSYGNLCKSQASQFVILAQGYPPLASSLTGQCPFLAI